MSASRSPSLHRTALYELHVAQEGRMVPFGGWEMPLQYAGILAEARAVRGGVGLFDVSHMGRLRFRGPDSVAFLEWLLAARVENLRPGRARYTLLLNEDGGIIDDTVVYRLDDGADQEARLLLVCNAATRDTVLAWLGRWSAPYSGAGLQDTTAETVMIAVQGPQAAALVDSFCSEPVSSLRPFAVTDREISLDSSPAAALVSRTGYTGEEGFELIVSAKDGPALWRLLQERGGTPCGLGARDNLRLEAALMLSGTDIDPSTTPLEADMERFIALDKEGFIGREALLAQQARGVKRKMVGFILLERGIPRHGYPILHDGAQVGSVTSGGYSPTLDMGIGMGYVAVEHVALDTQLTIDLRGRHLPVRVVALPFYRRA